MKRTTFFFVALAAAFTLACDGTDRSTDVTAPGERTETGTTAPGAENREGAATSGTAADREARDFVENMGIVNMAEIQLGKLAAERAMNAEVKQFAQRMIADHTKAGDELKQSASKLNIPYPTDLDDEHQELYDRLSKLRGQEFDREYISAMADGHQDVVDELEGQARTDRQPSGPTGTTGRADDSEAISQWASKTLPTVREHLERAKQIQEKIGKS